MFDEYKKKIEIQKREFLYRCPHKIATRKGKYIDAGGKRLINFSANDYLGLSSDRKIKEIIVRNFEKYPASSSSSRLVCGNYNVVLDAEKKVAEYFGYEDCIFFQTGFQANLALMSTIFLDNHKVFIDKHVHASTISGLKLGGVRFNTFKHNDLTHLKKRLNSNENKNSWVVTESIFSMDGDLLDVEKLFQLKDNYNFKLIVDEAHAVGILGKKGVGLAQGVADIAVGTFTKAFGFFGAFVLLPKIIKEYLFNFSIPLIYSTALPPAHSGCILDLIDIVEDLEDRRWYVQELSQLARQKLEKAGIKYTGSAHIITIPIGEEELGKNISEELISRGYMVFYSRYPTVPLGKSLLRISLCYFHTESDIIKFIELLKDILYKYGILK